MTTTNANFHHTFRCNVGDPYTFRTFAVRQSSGGYYNVFLVLDACPKEMTWVARSETMSMKDLHDAVATGIRNGEI